MRKNNEPHRPILLRQYIEDKFHPPSNWLKPDREGYITAHIGGSFEYGRGAPAYHLSRKWERIFRKITHRTWFLPFSHVFKEVKYIYVDEDLMGTFPDWKLYGPIYDMHAGINPLHDTNYARGTYQAFDKWIKIESRYEDWLQNPSDFLISAIDTEDGVRFWLDFPLFVYVDYISISLNDDTIQTDG